MKLSLPKDRIRVVLCESIHPIAEEIFREQGYSQVQRLPHAPGPEELQDLVRNSHILGIRSRTQIPQELLDLGNRLFCIGCFCIGTDQVDLAAAAKVGIPVFNAPHSNTRSVAELVLGFAIMLIRGIPDKTREAHQGRWQKTAKGSHELRGKTLGVVGYGHIGSQVSILAEALGLRVLFYDIEPRLPLGNARPTSSLQELLPQVDLLSLHVPDTPKTRGMIGPEELALMKPGSYLINTSRGMVVDHQALATALDQGRIGGAAIDVFPSEPKAKDEPFHSPLQHKRNVILTPHIGGSTEEAQENIAREVSHRLISFSDQGTSLGAVNFPQLGLGPHPGAHRLLHIHRNEPGVLRQINRCLGNHGLNILGQNLETRRDLGYVVIDIAPAENGKEILQELRAIPGTLRARILF
ncbi:MAG TPA: phosphoglycerate dehydrogenase [Planctomycetes bacterium]|nr:phosphoglycerate dehydrogenase [Planctomycetota bacterium]